MGDVHDGGYEVRVRWGLARTWSVFASAAIATVVVVFDPWSVPRGTGCVNAAVWGLLPIVDYARLRAKGCLLRIDGAGLTVSGRPTVPWSEVRKAEEARGAVVFFSWGAEERLPLLPYDILAFTGERRRRKQLTGRFGSPMVLPTRLYGVRPAEVMSAVRTYDGRAALFR
jgi:hypothetical protein